MFRGIVGCLAAAMASVAGGAAASEPDWIYVGSTNGKVDYFVDPDGLVAVPPSFLRHFTVVEFWVIARFRESDEDAVLSRVTELWRVDCQRRRYTIVEHVAYDPAGRPLGSQRTGSDDEADYERAAPGSRSEAVISTVCV